MVARAAALLRRPSRRRAPRPLLLSLYRSGRAAFLLARPIRNALFLKQYGPYALVYVYAAVPLVAVAVRAGLRAGRGPAWLADGRRRDAAVLQQPMSLLFWYAFRFHADAIAVTAFGGLVSSGRVLRLGQLLRRDRAGAGLELRQLAVRHAPGEAAVRADCRRRDRSERSAPVFSRACSSGRSAAP